VPTAASAATQRNDDVDNGADRDVPGYRSMTPSASTTKSHGVGGGKQHHHHQHERGVHGTVGLRRAAPRALWHRMHHRVRHHGVHVSLVVAIALAAMLSLGGVLPQPPQPPQTAAEAALPAAPPAPPLHHEPGASGASTATRRAAAAAERGGRRRKGQRRHPSQQQWWRRHRSQQQQQQQQQAAALGGGLTPSASASSASSSLAGAPRLADLTAGELGFDECDEGWTGIDCLDCLPGYSGEYCEEDEGVLLPEAHENEIDSRFSNGVTVDAATLLQDESGNPTRFSAGLTVTEVVAPSQTEHRQWWYHLRDISIMIGNLD
jgi:hypothetical protein